MTWTQRLLGLDRRIIFLLVGAGVALPLLFPLNLPVTPTPRVRAAFDTIQGLSPGSRVLISMDYEPDIMAELSPMSVGVLRHCFQRHLRVAVMTLYPAGVGLAQQAIRIAAEAEHAKPGEDYVFLGYKSGYQTVILGIGESLKSQYPTDFYGTPVGQIPMLKGVTNYAQFGLVVNLSGSNAADYWIQLAQTRHHARLVLGCTAVMATDYYPYLSSRQLLGLIGGMKGAAEYERLLGISGDGRRGMDAQSTVHVIVAILVLAGNAALLAAKRRGAAPAGAGAAGPGAGGLPGGAP